MSYGKKEKIYDLLVNKNAGIKYRYIKFSKNHNNFKKRILYLIELNFLYYCLGFKKIGINPNLDIYEKKELRYSESESSFNGDCDIDYITEYDIVSFDIFDTLIFRPFDNPTVLFQFLGEKLNFLNFEEIRISAEKEARKLKYMESDTNEVTLEDIYIVLGNRTGIDISEAIKMEKELEIKYCYANQYFYEVFQKLKEKKKKIIITSDMYLDRETIENILKKADYTGYDELFLSSELGKSKWDGSLFAHINENYRKEEQKIHIGDNYHSDIENATKKGWSTYHYKNINMEGNKYRAYDMSRIIGSCYRGIVNNQLYNGLNRYTMEYEYGFIYGGIQVLGFCNFIHDYKVKNKLDKILFLSRDGDIINQVYNILYPNENTEYVFWSRNVGTRLTSSYYKNEFINKFVRTKVSKRVTIKKVFESMGILEIVANDTIPIDSLLSDNNVDKVIELIEKKWGNIIEHYDSEVVLAKEYFEPILDNIGKVGIVDIGWAGSGVTSLRHLINRVWGYEIEVVGLVAGTNTIHNIEANSSEIFIQNGSMVSYMFSQSFNRDILKKHNLNKGYNVYLELLFGTPSRTFKGFYYDRNINNVGFVFGDKEKNSERIIEIQQGILDFVKEYQKLFEDRRYMFHISGRDAYAPFMLASSNNEKYLKVIYDNFNLEIDVV